MRNYSRPSIISEKSFERSALSCGKFSTPPVGSHHFTTAYETYTGHLGPGFGADESLSPVQVGVGFGPGGTSGSTNYAGICGIWVTLAS